MSGGFTVLIDEYPGGLYRHAKLSEDFSIVIADVVKTDPMPSNEFVH